MDNENFKKQCNDITKEFNIQIPCMLAERVESYASRNNTTIALNLMLQGTTQPLPA